MKKVSVLSRVRERVARWMVPDGAGPSGDLTRATPGGLSSIVGGGGLGNQLPSLSHGYVHEPFSGAWQRNQECLGPGGIFSAVYACVTTISGDIAKLPPKIRKQNADGSSELHDAHPAARVLWRPNSYQTHVDFWGQFMTSALFTGNTYALLVRDLRNVIAEMHLLDPRLCRPMLAPDGSVWYHTTQTQIVDALRTEYFPARDILHHRLLCLTHPLIGVSPLLAAAHSAQTGQVIQQNSLAFFSNMSRASGVLTTPDKISPDQQTRIQTIWEQNFKAGSLGRTAVLSGGLKWEPLSINAADAQLIEQLRWSVEDVARCFRVPMYMISDASKISYKNSEQLARNYYAQTLQYHLESIEARIEAAFELSGSVYCEFDLDTLLRMELDVRMAAYKEAISSGVMTINEARKREQLPPKEGGDEPLVQMQYIPLSRVGEQLDKGMTMRDTAPPPDPDAPPEDEPPEDEPEPGVQTETDAEKSARLTREWQPMADEQLQPRAAA
jgi:HK97 family phage portal protein